MTNKNATLRKTLRVVLAIIAALALWYYVDEHSDNGSARSVTMTVYDIPVEYVGEDALTASRLMLLRGEDSETDETIDLTFEGTRRSIVQLDRQKIRVTADVSGITAAGVQSVSYKISFTDRRFTSDNTKVKDSSFYMATVEICELNRKEIDVRCDVTGTVADGYSAGELRLSEPTVEISGQGTDLTTVSYAKIVLDIGNNATETVSKSLSCTLYDENDEEVQNSRILLSHHTVQATLPITVTREMKLLVDFLSAPGARIEDMEWTLLPDTILLSGESQIVESMDGIVLDSLDLLSVGPQMTEYSYPILIPDGCENLSGVTRATLRISYGAKTFADVKTENIECVNTPPDKNVEILTDRVSVRIFGTAEAVEKVEGEDLKIVADLSDYTEASGTYTVAGTAEIAEEKNVGVEGTYQVQIRISDREA